jgi:hypothetical protein
MLVARIHMERRIQISKTSVDGHSPRNRRAVRPGMNWSLTPEIQQLLKDDPEPSGCASDNCWNRWMHSEHHGAAGSPYASQS